MSLTYVVASLVLGPVGTHQYSVVFKPGTVRVEDVARYGSVISKENNLYVVRMTPRVAERLRRDTQRVLSLRDQAAVPNSSSVKSLAAHVEAIRAEERAAKRSFKGVGNEEGHLWYLQQRAFPNDSVDWSLYAKAAAHRDAMEKPATGPTDTSFWSYVGPSNMNTPQRKFFGLSPTNGKITAAVSHPTDLLTAYVGAPMGGVWKTTDGGVNWAPKSDDWSMMGVSSLAINVINPDFVYAGTGDFDGGLDYGHGIMVSDDAGTTWTESGAADFGSMPVSAITVDPENPLIVMATTGSRNSSSGGGVYRNTLGALFGSWTKPIVTAAKWTDIKYGAWDPSIGARRYYAIGSDSTQNYFRVSTDQGASWSAKGLPVGRQQRLNIATSKLFPQVIYLLACNAQRIYKSVNAGNSWTDITAGFPNGNVDQGLTYNWSQSTFYDSDIETSVLGNDADVVYVGLIDIARSPDGGASWQSIGGRTYEPGALVHNDQHVIANTADPDFMLVGNDGGAYHYTRGGALDVWFYRSNKLGVVQFYHSDHHPTDLTKMLGGTQDNGTPFANGNVADWDNSTAGDGGGCAIDPQNPSVQYSNAQRYSFDSVSGLCNIYQTTTAWGNELSYSFNPGNDVLPFVGEFQLDPNNSLVGYFGTDFLYRFVYTGFPGFGFFQSRLGGTQLATAGGTISSISICKADSGVIYTGSSAGDVFVTRDSGATFDNITGSLPNRSITDVDVNPNNSNEVLVVFSGFGSGHVYRCRNTSAVNPVWENVSGTGLFGLPDVPANTITRSAYDPDTTWWVGTDNGVFLTASEGSGWLNINGLGLPNVQVNDLTFVEGNSHVFAATFGRGMWHIEVFPPNEAISDADAPPSGTAGQAFPVTIILDHPAPDTGTWVYLSSNTPFIAPPARVYVPFNQSQVQFMCPTRIGSLSNVTGVLTAELLNSSKTMVVTLVPPSGLYSANLLNVVEGDTFSGGLADLTTYGGNAVSILSDGLSLGGRMELRGASPVQVPSAMSFYWASSVGRPGLAESVEMYDTTTSQWVAVAGRVAPITNSYNLITSVSIPARFVGPNSNSRVAFDWQPINDEDPSQDGWLLNLDLVLWRVVP